MKHLLTIAVVAIFALSAIFVGCEKNDGIMSPSSSSKSANTVSFQKTTYPAVTVSSSGHPSYTWDYSIVAEVEWSGSTTTWTYTVTGTGNALSHTDINLGCALANVSSIGQGGASVSNDPGGCTNTGNVIKWNADGNTGTYSFTLNGAYNVGSSLFFVKAGNACQSVAVPGPGCDLLSLSGNVTKTDCDGNQTVSGLAFAGQTVTATQGSDVRTTETDADGNYSFSNLGGEWTVSVGDQSSTVDIGPDNGTANFSFDVRPNGSCAQVTGNLTITYCEGGASITDPIANATVTLGSATATTDPQGNYSFSNVSVGLALVMMGTTQVGSVDVTDASGSYDAGSYNDDQVPAAGCQVTCLDADGNGLCDDLEGCAFSQGYYFGGTFFDNKGNVKQSWPGGNTVTVAGWTYTMAEANAIWKMKGSKQAPFTQAVALIKSNLPATSTVALGNLQTIENFYTGKGKLSPTNMPTPTTAVANAAGAIGSWINIHHCP
jgi:hypothetical protein